MTAEPVLTEQVIREFVAAWFRALDFHVPLAEISRFLAVEGLHMDFPDGAIRDAASFQTWYDRVTHLFFDESHTVQAVTSAIAGDEAVLDIQVGWQASWWEPPAARSQRVAMDATQRWTVRRSLKAGLGLEIVSYNATVEPFRYAPGCAHL